jgi:hypothetical protein
MWDGSDPHWTSFCQTAIFKGVSMFKNAPEGRQIAAFFQLICLGLTLNQSSEKGVNLTGTT